MSEIRKAIIPLAGLGTRFLPLSKVVPKEFFPVVDLPLIHYILLEAKESGIEEIIFITSPGDKKIFDYLKPSQKIEKILKERGKKKLLAECKEFKETFKNMVFSSVLQKKPLGDGHAILQAEKMIKGESVGCLFVDDIVDSETPCLLQLSKIFKTCQKPVLALYPLPREKISSYGVVKVEKIANRLYKIKEIVEKPSVEQAPSNLAIVGKYVLTPEVFEYLKKAKLSEKGEIILAEVLNKMLEDGKLIYGYEIEGKWLECGNKLEWLKTHLYFSLRHPKFGAELRDFLKKI